MATGAQKVAGVVKRVAQFGRLTDDDAALLDEVIGDSGAEAPPANEGGSK